MTIKELNKKFGKCEYELAFADKTTIKRIAQVYISESKKLIILKSPQGANLTE
jgi:hypothetical protein